MTRIPLVRTDFDHHVTILGYGTVQVIEAGCSVGGGVLLPEMGVVEVAGQWFPLTQVKRMTPVAQETDVELQPSAAPAAPRRTRRPHSG